MFCVYCGQQVSNGARFCSKCGKPRTPRPEEVSSNAPSSPKKYFLKYDFTGETKTVGEKKHPVTVYRIIRNDGVLGGWIQSETNLSRDGNCWVGENAVVYGDAKVEGNAQVLGTAVVKDQARIYDDAVVCGNCIVTDTVRVHGHAKLYEECIVFDDAGIDGNALVHGNAKICADAYVSGEVYGEAWVTDHAHVIDSAKVYEKAYLRDNAEISGNAQVHGKSDIRGCAKIGGHAEVFGTSTVRDNGKVNGYARCENTHITDDACLYDEIWAQYCDFSGYVEVRGYGKLFNKTIYRRISEPGILFHDGVEQV